ncbi:MAG TPA: hypothetical protein VGZ29_05645 [Terriglobia bacterium]|nr:hypothetical protein [Terriglobia bacterium]
MKLRAATLKALHAEWRKFSPSVTSELPEREARIEWTNRALNQRLKKADRARMERTVASWNDLQEGEARYLLRRMRGESGDAAAWRANLIARLAVELWGSQWDEFLHQRLGDRFRVGRAEDLSPRDGRATVEELVSRIARRDGIEIEAVRAKYSPQRAQSWRLTGGNDGLAKGHGASGALESAPGTQADREGKAVRRAGPGSRKGGGMSCPVCKSDDREVEETRQARDGYKIRLNQCKNCGSRYATRVHEDLVPILEYNKARAASRLQ